VPLKLLERSLLIIVFCVGILAYSNTFQNSFQFDGKRELVENPAIRDISRAFTIPPQPRFISNLSFAINYKINKLDVAGYHIFNLAIHLGAAALVWWLVLLTLSSPAVRSKPIARHSGFMAFFASLIFVAHPVQTQAVTYIMQRPTSLAVFFYLASLCFYIKWRLVKINGSSTIFRPLYIFGFFITVISAFYTKELVITLPLMILLYETCFLRIKDYFKWRYLAAVLILGILIYVAVIAPRLTMLDNLADRLKIPMDVSGGKYILTQFRVLMTYIRLLFIPINQNVDYDYPVVSSIFELPVLLSIFSLLSILLISFKLYRKYRLISFGILSFFIALLPEFTVMPLYFYLNRIPREIIFEERLYLAMTGYSIFLVSTIYWLFGRESFKRAALILCAVAVLYAALTYNRNFVWKDEYTLWSDAVSKSPNKARPYGNRGRGLADKSRYEEAILDFTKAIELDPGYTDAYYNRAFVNNLIGNTDEAILDYTRAAKTNPGYFKAYFNRGNVYKKQGELDNAIRDYTITIKLDKTHFGAYGNRGNVYVIKGEFDKAISDYNNALKLNPDSGLVYYARGAAYFKMGQIDKAREDFKKAEEKGFKLR